MDVQIDRLLTDFEDGRLSRRELGRRLSGMVMALAAAGSNRAAAQESPSTFAAVGLNHLALDVTDVGRSRDFYVQHLGLEVARESASNCFLTAGEQFVALFRSREAGMNHYCYSVRDYDVGTAADRLRAQSIEPRISGRRIYFPDPDGLTVQLAAADHRP